MTSTNEWDPDHLEDTIYSPLALVRIKKDIAYIVNNPSPGIHIHPDAECFNRLHALIIGPADTPYEGGFFHFLIVCPPTFPVTPPRIKLLTTGGGRVRFNPNLYANGKVCLSILGTWSGPGWTPAITLHAVLLSVQSLLNETPFENEPGFDNDRAGNAEKIQRYNEIVRHETIRAAVCEVLEQPDEQFSYNGYINSIAGRQYGKSLANWNCLPAELLSVARANFPKDLDRFVAVCLSNEQRDGEPIMDPFGESRGHFQYKTLMKRLQHISVGLDLHFPSLPSSSGCSSSIICNSSSSSSPLAAKKTWSRFSSSNELKTNKSYHHRKSQKRYSPY